MSEVKLNIIDAQNILTGTIHGSIADRCVAALSAEPETIAELEAALVRYIKPQDGEKLLPCFRSSSEIDSQPWDAGLVIIDLAARIVATESTYSQPGPEGEVSYHDGTKATEISIGYCLPADWLFVNSMEAYVWSSERHRQKRMSRLPFDARAVLYGPALLEFIVESGLGRHAKFTASPQDDEESQEALRQEISAIHASWLLTPRDDLRRQSPRDVLLEKRHLIDCDLDSRSFQWTLVGEGPPCLAADSLAYRFAGFGTHEWVVYYDMVRHLLRNAAKLDCQDRHTAVNRLDQIKTNWLETGDGEYDQRIPALIIENERRRLPQTVSASELIIDEDCECCRMLAMDAEMGFGPTFWHLDGSHMDDGFAFSTCLTHEEWETEIREREEFDREFDRRMEERRQSIARGEIVQEPSLADHSF
jgi:hypothetical protein